MVGQREDRGWRRGRLSEVEAAAAVLSGAGAGGLLAAYLVVRGIVELKAMVNIRDDDPSTNCSKEARSASPYTSLVHHLSPCRRPGLETKQVLEPVGPQPPGTPLAYLNRPPQRRHDLRWVLVHNHPPRLRTGM